MKILSKFITSMQNMNNIAKNVLLIGQCILLITLIAIVGYIIIFDGQIRQYNVYHNLWLFFDSIIAGVLTLWGGAFFIDCLDKYGT